MRNDAIFCVEFIILIHTFPAGPVWFEIVQLRWFKTNNPHPNGKKLQKFRFVCLMRGKKSLLDGVLAPDASNYLSDGRIRESKWTGRSHPGQDVSLICSTFLRFCDFLKFGLAPAQLFKFFRQKRTSVFAFWLLLRVFGEILGRDMAD